MCVHYVIEREGKMSCERGTGVGEEREGGREGETQVTTN